MLLIIHISDGGWSDWGSFGTCSVTCGVGVKIRSRTCSNPKPSLEGKHCQGSPVQVAVCSKNPCPGNRLYSFNIKTRTHNYASYKMDRTSFTYIQLINVLTS